MSLTPPSSHGGSSGPSVSEFFKGWTSDSMSPATVTTNGGNLTANDGGEVSPDALVAGSGTFGTSPTGPIGFFGEAVAQPVVPATPLPQDIVDAMVSLGLVSQAS